MSSLAGKRSFFQTKRFLLNEHNNKLVEIIEVHALLQVVKEADWRPPTPPKVDISLQQYIAEFKKDETPNLPKIPEVINDKERVFKEDCV